MEVHSLCKAKAAELTATPLSCRVLDQQCVVPFVWVGRIIAMSSRRLVPGDVVVLQRGKATCDMVLLRGAGLVEESMMSGEVSIVSCICLYASCPDKSSSLLSNAIAVRTPFSLPLWSVLTTRMFLHQVS